MIGTGNAAENADNFAEGVGDKNNVFNRQGFKGRYKLVRYTAKQRFGFSYRTLEPGKGASESRWLPSFSSRHLPVLSFS